jgi:hypothetical protein
MARLSFSEYVCLGDCAYVEDGLFSFRIRVEHDGDNYRLITSVTAKEPSKPSSGTSGFFADW